MRRFSLVLSLLFVAALSWAQSTGWGRYRVAIESEKDAQRLADSSIPLFSEQISLGPVDVIVGPEHLVEFWKLGLKNEYVGELPRPDAWKDRVTTALDDYQQTYLQYASIIGKYEGWRAANPTLVTRVRIGQGQPSLANDIWSYRIYAGTGVPRHGVVIIGGIHAREWISPAVCMYLFDNLINKIKTDESWALLMKRTALYVIPSLNPDGYKYTWSNNRMWRKNRRNSGGGNYGVDLNRNYPIGWGGGGSSGSTGSDTYRGPSAASEPETQALINHALSLPNVSAFIDFHSYGQYILWPWGYTSALCPDDADHSRVGLMMQSLIAGVYGSYYTAGPITTTLYQASGNTVDYFYQTFKARSYTIELRDTGVNGFLLPEAQIYPTQVEAWAGFERFLKLAGMRRIP